MSKEENLKRIEDFPGVVILYVFAVLLTVKIIVNKSTKPKEDSERPIIQVLMAEDSSYTVYVADDMYEYLNKRQVDKLLLKYDLDSLKNNDTFIAW